MQFALGGNRIHPPRTTARRRMPCRTRHSWRHPSECRRNCSCTGFRPRHNCPCTRLGNKRAPLRRLPHKLRSCFRPSARRNIPFHTKEDLRSNCRHPTCTGLPSNTPGRTRHSGRRCLSERHKCPGIARSPPHTGWLRRHRPPTVRIRHRPKIIVSTDQSEPVRADASSRGSPGEVQAKAPCTPRERPSPRLKPLSSSRVETMRISSRGAGKAGSDALLAKSRRHDAPRYGALHGTRVRSCRRALLSLARLYAITN